MDVIQQVILAQILPPAPAWDETKSMHVRLKEHEMIHVSCDGLVSCPKGGDSCLFWVKLKEALPFILQLFPTIIAVNPKSYY